MHTRNRGRYLFHCSVFLVFATLALPGALRAHEINLPDGEERLGLSRVSDTVYALQGVLGLPDRDNKAFISNSGIVITPQGVVIIDSGGSRQVGEMILEEIDALTDKPDIAIFNTHVHGDHWMGNAAIRRAFPQVKIYAHKRAITRLAEGEAGAWLDTMQRMTQGATGDTEPVLPETALEGGEQLVFGGLDFKIHHTGHAHTDSDIRIELPAERVLFTGDIVEHRRAVSVDVPADFCISGQIAAIRYLLELPVEVFVPGHGDTGDRQIPESSLRFLETLLTSVERNYAAGLQDFEMQPQVIEDLDEFQGWSGMDQVGRLISFVYLQVEEASFD